MSRSATVGDVCTVVGGGTPTRTVTEYYGGSIPWVTPKDMKTWEIHGAQVNITRAGLDNSSTRLVPTNSVLVVVRSGVLKHTVPVAINRVPVAINQDMKALLCSDAADPDYVARFLKTRSPVILQWVRATTADNFPIDKLKQLEIPLPPLLEQRRIADILDKADALRAKRSAAIVKLDTLSQSIFFEMFGDPARNTKRLPTTLLGDLGNWQSGGTPPRQSEEYFGGSVPWFSSGELGQMYLSQSRECVTDKALKETAAKVVPRGSLMLGMYDTAALKASLAGVDCSCNQAIAFATIDPKYAEPVFVYFSIVIGREHFRRQQRGVRQKNLNLTMVREIRIPLPPIALQRRFADEVTAVGRLQSLYRAAKNEVDALFATLQHRAFRGALSRG